MTTIEMAMREWRQRVAIVNQMNRDLQDEGFADNVDDMEMIAESMKSELERALIAVRIARMLEEK